MKKRFGTVFAVMLMVLLVIGMASCSRGSGGGRNSNPLVGTWETDDGIARYVFKADGTGTFEEGSHGVHPIAYTVETFTHEGDTFYQIYHGASDGGTEIINPYGTINYEGGDEFRFGGIFKRKQRFQKHGTASELDGGFGFLRRK